MRWDILGGCFEMGYIEVEGVRQAAGQVLEEYGKSLMQQGQKNSVTHFTRVCVFNHPLTEPYEKSLQQSKKKSEGFMILTVTPFTSVCVFNYSLTKPYGQSQMQQSHRVL